MAHCIPDQLPDNASQGEVRVFKILRGLPDDCIVYYEPIVQNRYADFIVLLPALGLLVIEVKGWLPDSILHGDLNEVLVNYEGTEQRLRHPIRQARDYMNSLMNVCQKHRGFKKLIHSSGKHQGRFIFPFGSFSVMSNITRNQIDERGLSEIFPSNKVVAKDELKLWEGKTGAELLETLQAYFDPWWPITPMSKDQVDTLRAIIHPEVLLLPLVESTTEEQQASIKVLDLRQESNARNIGTGHRIIYGVPGSGKTVLILARAKLVAASNRNKKHLLLCYNVTLAAYLRKILFEHTNVYVRHFDGWCKDQGVTRQYSENDDSLGERLLKLLQSKGGQAGQYSSVFIDEAQDFDESWFKCALGAMADPVKGDLVVVADGNQGLYRHRKFTWSDVGIQARGRTINTKFDLDKAYRSSKEIASLARAFATGDGDDAETAIASMSFDPEKCVRANGYKPILVQAADYQEECDYAGAIVAELLAGKWFGRDIEAPLHPSEIGILYPRAMEELKELLSELQQSIGPAIWINQNSDSRERINEDGVKIQTIYSAKGLQYKAVIVIGAGLMPGTFGQIDPVTERKLMFVGLTRAEDYLAVIYSTPGPFALELNQTGEADILKTQKVQESLER